MTHSSINFPESKRKRRHRKPTQRANKLCDSHSQTEFRIKIIIVFKGKKSGVTSTLQQSKCSVEEDYCTDSICH